MGYVEVVVADSSYHGDKPLVYRSKSILPGGNVVNVPLRNKEVTGITIKQVTKPEFAVKAITSIPALPPIPSQLVALLLWMHSYYPSPYGMVARHFLPRKLPKEPLDPITNTDSSARTINTTLPLLTSDQQQALSKITSPGTYLLHGDTGTGKTRVYIELARASLVHGKSVLILTPEIGLTSQLANDFRKLFSKQVVILHSRLTESRRRQIWTDLLRQTSPVIVIGPRSALFAPLARIGLIVIDEFHDNAYKQDQAPHYHAVRVATKLGSLHSAQVILGSATPSITDYFLATAKSRPILRMDQIASKNTAAGRKITVIDLSDRTKFTKSYYLSDKLLEELALTLKQGEQSLVFLNRRGTARVVFCEQCGWQANCPHCDLPLVYHGDIHLMRCHTCDFKSLSPTSCPNCHNNSIVFRRIGTKALVSEIEKFFPDAYVMRFDTDNNKPERIEQNYEGLKSGKVDIIVGTQTIAKGLDLPRLGLVGIVIADSSLYFPDFSAQERTYQLINQVIGRVGRGYRSSKVILQTYSPDSPLLRSVLHKDWETFYQTELTERKSFLFPPYCYLLKLWCRRTSRKTAESAAGELIKLLSSSGLRIALEGPVPAFRERVQGRYEWQIIVKSKNRAELLQVIGLLPANWLYDIDPVDLL
jgi:primosomal protein N' (replication factor Y)